MLTDDEQIEILNKVLPNGFSIEKSLKKGGQGAVFLGSYNAETVALKIFFTSAEHARIDRELAALKSLNCENLVRVVADSRVQIHGENCRIVAYEYYPGGDLRQPIDSGIKLPEQTLARVGLNISVALETLWDRRIVHRDVKPDNIVKTGQGDFVLVDVGIARHLDLTTLTSLGMVVGTRGYMSPEQERGRRKLTINSDIFSLGITLYELATGTMPFESSSALTSTPTPLETLRPDLTTPLVSLVSRMLDVRVSHRPQSPSNIFAEMLGR